MANSPRNLAILLALLSPFLLGCATISTGTTQAITIDSNIKGADVQIEGNHVGVTPFSGKIKRQKDAIAMVTMDGYAPQAIPLTTSFNSVAVLNIFWDLSTTDFLTGAVWEYAPNSYYANLKPSGMADASFKQQTTAIAFAMTYFGNIKTELVAGRGPLLNTLQREYFQAYTSDQLVDLLRSVDQSDAVEFGEAVGTLFLS